LFFALLSWIGVAIVFILRRRGGDAH
jgi:hypothetical protein